MDPARFTARVDPRMQPQEVRRCVPVAFPPEVGVPGGAWWDILLSRYPSTREEPSVSPPRYRSHACSHQVLQLSGYLRRPQISVRVRCCHPPVAPSLILTNRLENTSYWLIFLDRNTFLDRLADVNFRASIEPSLILSALALSNLMQSSEVGRGEAGRNLAVGLRNAAQSSMEAACNDSRVHYTLAEAAIVRPLPFWARLPIDDPPPPDSFSLRIILSSRILYQARQRSAPVCRQDHPRSLIEHGRRRRPRRLWIPTPFNPYCIS